MIIIEYICETCDITIKKLSELKSHLEANSTHYIIAKSRKATAEEEIENPELK